VASSSAHFFSPPGAKLTTPYDRLNELSAMLTNGRISREDFDRERAQIYAANSWGAPPPVTGNFGGAVPAPTQQRLQPASAPPMPRRSAAQRRSNRNRYIALAVVGALILIGLIAAVASVAGK
jgi:hypothetical protein